MLSRTLAAFVIVAASAAQAQTQAPDPQAPAAPPARAEPTETSPSPTPTLAPAPAPTEKVSGQGEISLDDWTRDDWKLVQPRVALVELDGYLRLRSDMLRKLDFGNGATTEYVSAPDSSATPAPRYPGSDGGTANFSSTNMRLRIEPTLNVSENLHIITTIDVLDNLVMGSTPHTVNTADGYPINVLGNGQQVPKAGVNSVYDSIAVKRAYARLTALNEQLELTFGRMPSQWGLGILSNAGDCLDCDYGDVVDRIALTFKAADLLLTPMFDWVSSGPLIQPFGRSGGQPLDAAPWEDAGQYSLRVQRVDGENDIKDRVLQGQTVLNYGAWGIWRRQKSDLAKSYYNTATVAGTSPSLATAATDFPREERSANILTGDGYLRLYHGRLSLSLEGVVLYGSFKMPTMPTSTTTTSTTSDVTLESNSMLQYGGAAEIAWHGEGEAKNLTLSLKGGAASGDKHRGFGALDQTGTQRGSTGGGDDTSLDNFQFSPDYHIDLLMFRRIIGTVTDAWYVRPELSYVFANSIGGRAWAVYSQAMKKASTYRGTSLPLGIEVDGELSYGLIANPEGGSFKGSVAGGLLFPFSGFKSPTDGTGGSLAWTLQARLYVTF